MFGTLVIVAQNLWFLIFLLRTTRRSESSRPTLAHWLITQASLGLLLIPFAKILLHNLHKVQRGFWIPRPSPFTLIQTLVEYTGLDPLVPDSLYDVAKHHKSLTLLAIAGAAIFIILLCAVIARLQKSWDKTSSASTPKPSDPAWLFLTIWAAVIILLPYIWSFIGTPMFVSRYAMAASCAIYLLAALGLESFLRHRLAGLALVGLVLALSLWSDNTFYSYNSKAPWRQAAAYLDANAHPGDLVLVSRPLSLNLLLNYYSRRTDLIKVPITDPDEPVNEQTADSILSVAQGHDRIWLVYHHDNDPKHLLISRLAQNHQQITTPFDRYGTFDVVTLKLFEKQAQPTPATRPGEAP